MNGSRGRVWEGSGRGGDGIGWHGTAGSGVEIGWSRDRWGEPAPSDTGQHVKQGTHNPWERAGGGCCRSRAAACARTCGARGSGTCCSRTGRWARPALRLAAWVASEVWWSARTAGRGRPGAAVCRTAGLPGFVLEGRRQARKYAMLELGVPGVLRDERLGHRPVGVRGVCAQHPGAMHALLLTGLRRL
jgi:hypothetical protein